jgi:hypothetical protein
MYRNWTDFDYKFVPVQNADCLNLDSKSESDSNNDTKTTQATSLLDYDNTDHSIDL